MHEATELNSSSATYYIALTEAPADTVTIKTVHSANDITITPETLTFTEENWSAQSVTVTVQDDSREEGNHFATIIHEITSNDGDYSALGAFNVEFPVSDNEKPEVLILPTDNSTNVTERTTTDLVYQGQAAGGTLESLVMPTVSVINLSTDSLSANHSFTSATNLDNYTASWSTAANSEIEDDTTVPHITIEGTGEDEFDYYKFTVSNSPATYTFDIDGGMLGDGSFDPYLHLYKKVDITLPGFFKIPIYTEQSYLSLIHI